MESTATVLYEILNLKSISKVTVCQNNNKIVYKLASVREAKHYELIEEELRSLQLQSNISIDASNETCPDSNVKSLSETEHEFNFSIPIFSKFYGCCELSSHSEITKDIVVLNKDKLKAWMKLENLFTNPKSSFIEYKIGRITYGKEWDAIKSARRKLVDESTTTKSHCFRLTNYRIEYEDHTDVWTIKRYRNENFEYDFTIPELVHDFSKGLIKELLKDAAKRTQVIVKIERLIHYFKYETKYEFRGMSVIIIVSDDAWDARLIDLEYMYEIKEEEREAIQYSSIKGLKNIINLINSVFENDE